MSASLLFVGKKKSSEDGEGMKVCAMGKEMKRLANMCLFLEKV